MYTHKCIRLFSIYLSSRLDIPNRFFLSHNNVLSRIIIYQINCQQYATIQSIQMFIDYRLLRVDATKYGRDSIDLIRSNFRQAGDKDENYDYETNEETATTGRLEKKLPPDLYIYNEINLGTQQQRQQQ